MNPKHILGAAGVVCAAVLFHSVLPGLLTDLYQNTAASTLSARLENLESSPEQHLSIASARAGVAAEVAPAQPQVVPAGENPASRVLMEVTRGGAWMLMDLSDWEQVARLGMSFETSLSKLLQMDSESIPSLVAGLEQSQSIGSKQILLVALGAFEYPQPNRLQRYLSQPSLASAAAYAIGRAPGSAGLGLLEEAYANAIPFSEERTGILLGFAQEGVPGLSQLIAAARAQGVLKPNSDQDQPLWYARGPGVAEALTASLFAEQDQVLADSILRALTFGPCEFQSLDMGADLTQWLEARLPAFSNDEQRLSLAMQALLRHSPESFWSNTPLIAQALPGDHAIWTAGALSSQDWSRAADLLTLWGGDGHLPPQAGEARLPLLRTLPRLLFPEADQLTATALLQGTAEERSAILEGLAERARSASLDQAAGSLPPGPQTRAALEALLSSHGMQAEESIQVIALLRRDPSASPEEQARWDGWALAALEQTIGSGHDVLELLVNHAGALGSAGQALLIDEFQRQSSLVARLELLNSLTTLQTDSDSAIVERFMLEEALPFARDNLGRLGPASLAYFGRVSRPNLALTSLIGLFGIYGNRDDIDRIEWFLDTLDETCHDWPESIRTAVLSAGDECGLRALDLLRLKS
jgi:hypothetical protein